VASPAIIGHVRQSISCGRQPYALDTGVKLNCSTTSSLLMMVARPFGDVDCDEPRLMGGRSFRTMRLPLVKLSAAWEPRAAVSLPAPDVVENAGCSRRRQVGSGRSARPARDDGLGLV
jgi:hypothetical protein